MRLAVRIARLAIDLDYAIDELTLADLDNDVVLAAPVAHLELAAERLCELLHLNSTLDRRPLLELQKWIAA